MEQSLYEYYGLFQPYKVTDYSIRRHNDFPSGLNEIIVSKYLGLEKVDDKW